MSALPSRHTDRELFLLSVCKKCNCRTIVSVFNSQICTQNDVVLTEGVVIGGTIIDTKTEYGHVSSSLIKGITEDRCYNKTGISVEYITGPRSMRQLGEI